MNIFKKVIINIPRRTSSLSVYWGWSALFFSACNRPGGTPCLGKWKQRTQKNFLLKSHYINYVTYLDRAKLNDSFKILMYFSRNKFNFPNQKQYIILNQKARTRIFLILYLKSLHSNNTGNSLTKSVPSCPVL